MTSLADRVRAFIKAQRRPGQQADETELTGRAAARRYVRGSGPWQHFAVSRDSKRTRKPGRARWKRMAARLRAQGRIA